MSVGSSSSSNRSVGQIVLEELLPRLSPSRKHARSSSSLRGSGAYGADDKRPRVSPSAFEPHQSFLRLGSFVGDAPERPRRPSAELVGELLEEAGRGGVHRQSTLELLSQVPEVHERPIPPSPRRPLNRGRGSRWRVSASAAPWRGSAWTCPSPGTAGAAPGFCGCRRWGKWTWGPSPSRRRSRHSRRPPSSATPFCRLRRPSCRRSHRCPLCQRWRRWAGTSPRFPPRFPPPLTRGMQAAQELWVRRRRR